MSRRSSTPLRKPRLTFLGGAGNVTGSSSLLEVGGSRILVDCGLFQEWKHLPRNWASFPFDPAALDAVLVTHAHLDHVGRLPLLVKRGFQGPIHCTAATAEITRIVLQDAGHLQEEDAAFKAKRHLRENRRGPHPVEPLYTRMEARAVTPLFRPVRYEEELRIGEDFTFSFHDAGHILGSAMIRVMAGKAGDRRTVLFSGDVGRRGKPIIEDPTAFRKLDHVVVESTYGDRVHEPARDIEGALATVITETHRAGGNVVIPSFAVHRAHELLFHLQHLVEKKKIPPMPIFLDSPMAVEVAEVFQRHPELFDEEMRARLARGSSPFDFPGLRRVRTVDESKAINTIEGPVTIIAGAGMCNGGRIKHHLVTNITRPASTVLFVGHQAEGTLGRQILDGKPVVRILGQELPVRARVARIEGFSAHADRDELIRWLLALESPPRRVFITHGDPEASRSFRDLLVGCTGWKVSIPDHQESVILE